MSLSTGGRYYIYIVLCYCYDFYINYLWIGAEGNDLFENINVAKSTSTINPKRGFYRQVIVRFTNFS